MHHEDNRDLPRRATHPVHQDNPAPGFVSHFGRGGPTSEVKKFAVATWATSRRRKSNERMKTNNGTRKGKQKPRDGIFLSKQTLDKLLGHKQSDAMIALYVFLNYTALWQETNQPKATVEFIARGIGWGVNKVREIKSLLVQAGLIEDVCTVDPQSKRITGHYIRVSYFHPHCFGEDGKATLTVLPRVAKQEANALRANNSNALRPNKLSKERTGFLQKPGVYFLEGLDEDEREIVIHYNETLVPLGWMPVTKVTDELRKCFEAHYDVETFCELIEQTADAPETWPKHRRSRTIFRVGWDNY